MLLMDISKYSWIQLQTVTAKIVNWSINVNMKLKFMTFTEVRNFRGLFHYV